MKARYVFLWIGVVLCFGFVAASCDLEDEAKDEAMKNVDTSFEKDAELELEPIEAEQTAAKLQPLDMDCGITSVNEELERNDVDTEGADIDSITLEYVEAKYADAMWEPVEVGSVSCAMTLWGDAGSALIVEQDVVKGSMSWTPIEVDANAEELINYYLAHRDEEFNYCVECTDADSYHVMWYVRIGVLVEGEASGA
ncbi:MAG: hypothetical protein M5R36_08870 [Deltaproteobacteria bacterium]|nr:hypothetical protein [Deltaproteobacteria bacterium]